MQIMLKCAVLAAFLILGLVPQPVHGQEEATPPATTTSTAPAAPTLDAPSVTREEIEARIASVVADTSLEEAQKTRITELYQQAVASLERAAAAQQRMAEYQQLQAQAPQALEQARAERKTLQDAPPPEIPPDADLETLEQRLSEANAALAAARSQRTEVADAQKRRSDRRTQVPDERAALQNKLTGLGEAAAPVDAEAPPELRRAHDLARQLQQAALRAELDVLDQELAAIDARAELLKVRVELADLRVKHTEKVVAAWQAAVNARRDRIAAERQAAAERALEEARHPVVREQAQLLTEEAEQLKRISDQIQALQALKGTLQPQLEQLRTRFEETREQIEAVGLTSYVGLALRNEREQLKRVRQYEQTLRERQAEQAQMLIAEREVADTLAKLQDPNDYARELLRRADVPQRQWSTLVPNLVQQLQQREETLGNVADNLDRYVRLLAEVNASEHQLVEAMHEFSDYVDRHVLWIRSAGWPAVEDLRDGWDAIRWLGDAENWASVPATSSLAVQNAPGLHALVAIVFLLLLAARPRLHRGLRHEGEIAARNYTTRFLPTIRATLFTIVLAAQWPVLLAFLGWHLQSVATASDFSRALGSGLAGIAPGYLLLELLRQICRPGGLGAAHFNWSERALRLVRRQLLWFVPIAIFTGVVLIMVEWTRNPGFNSSLSRLAFIVAEGLLALFLIRVLHPRHGAFQEAMAANPGSWFDRTRNFWYALALGVPIALILLALSGWYYTALQLAGAVQTSLFLLLALLVVNALALRWILVSHRALAIEQLRKRREAAAAAAESAGTEHEAVEEPALDVTIVSLQIRRLLRSFTILAIIFGLWFVWVDEVPALEALDRVNLWATTETVVTTETTADGQVIESTDERPGYVTLAELVVAILIVLITLMISRNLPGLLEVTVLQKLPLQSGERYAITTLINYVALIIGFIVAFSAIGIGWSKVQWLVAAISVGLGFGLQEIFANFVSGLILLFERPVRIGDIITIGGVDGQVTRIRMRATTIVDWDRRELVVPNKDFVTGQLINWTLSDSVTRVIIPVGIAYGSDTKKAETLLYKVAHESPLVLDKPAPMVLFRAFGDSTLDFQLRVFLPSMANWQRTVHELHMAIDQAFRAGGVEIAFPQRDIHVRSIKDILPIQNRPGRTPAEELPPAS